VVGQVTNASARLAAFRGIPYGTAGRWRAPVAAQCTPGSLLNATAPKRMCWQMNGHVYGPAAGAQSEDCLNLDVYSRFSLSGSSGRSIHPRGPVPVVVWLYGGSLIAGSTSSYPGLSRLALLEDWILVAPNYRLGAFGFLAHPSLSATDPRGTSGNYGLLDQQLALRWVRDNAAAFGGDPARVMLLGQSSGGTSILALLASEASKGLFHAAVSLSASPNISMNLTTGEEAFTGVVARRTNCSCSGNSVDSTSGGGSSGSKNSNCGGGGTRNHSVFEMQHTAECLRRLPAASVAGLLPSTFDVSPALPLAQTGQEYPGLPLVDGRVVLTDVQSALASGLVDVPLLLQTELAEMDTYEKSVSAPPLMMPLCLICFSMTLL